MCEDFFFIIIFLVTRITTKYQNWPKKLNLIIRKKTVNGQSPKQELEKARIWGFTFQFYEKEVIQNKNIVVG